MEIFYVNSRKGYTRKIINVQTDLVILWLV